MGHAWSPHRGHLASCRNRGVWRERARWLRWDTRKCSTNGKLGRGHRKWQENPIYRIICALLMGARAWAGPTGFSACRVCPDSSPPAPEGWPGGPRATASSGTSRGRATPGSGPGTGPGTGPGRAWRCWSRKPGCLSGRAGELCQAGERRVGAAGRWSLPVPVPSLRTSEQGH